MVSFRVYIIRVQRNSENRHTVQSSAACNCIGMHRHLHEECTRQLVRQCTYSPMRTCTHTHVDKRRKKTHAHAKPNVDMPNRDEHKSKQSMQTQRRSSE